MRKRTWFLWIMVFAVAVAISGCATTPNVSTEKSASQIAKEKSLYFMEIYKAQFADAAAMGAMAQKGELSLEQVKIYRVKRELLIKLKPLIEAYDAILAGGGIPGPGREQEINNVINLLVSKAGGA